jgi:YcaO-like protein with predicted kinase domain
VSISTPWIIPIAARCSNDSTVRTSPLPFGTSPAPTGLAAYHCLIAERADDPLRRLYAAEGCGCHLARHVALMRALTEAAQSRLTAISGARDDMARAHFRHWRDPSDLEYMNANAAIRGQRSYREAPSFESDSFQEDIDFLLDAVRRYGCGRVIVYDLSLPEFGIPVVRVIIPGMQMELSVTRAPYAEDAA